MANIFEKFPMSKLSNLIGEENLESIREIINITGTDNIDPQEMYSQSFLAKVVKQNIGSSFIRNKEKMRELIDVHNPNEIKEIIDLLGITAQTDRNSNIAEIIRLMSQKKHQATLSNHWDIPVFEESDSDKEKIDDIQIPRSEIPYKPLKDYQFEVLFKALSNLEHNNSRFILQMPTGSGKTRTAIEVIAHFLNTYKDSSVIWLAHSTELCDQAAECFLEVLPHIATEDVNFKRHYGPHFKIDTLKDDKKIDFLCAGFQSTYSSIKRDPDSLNKHLNKHRLIVVDEAHKATAETYNKGIKSFFNNQSKVMGLTATPGRSFNQLNSIEENKKLTEFFFDEIVSFKPPEGKSAIAYLRDKKILAQAKLEVLKTEKSRTLTPLELTKISEELEIPRKILVEIGKDNLRNAEIILKIEKLVKEREYKSIIYFATSLEQSRLISQLLSFKGIKSIHIDGGTPSIIREQGIKQFRNQEVEVLCNYEVLATGFDAPLVDCVFIARPTASVILYSQMIGRGLRGPEIGGKKKCLIVNVRDNFTNFPSIENMYEVFEDYWV